MHLYYVEIQARYEPNSRLLLASRLRGVHMQTTTAFKHVALCRNHSSLSCAAPHLPKSWSLSPAFFLSANLPMVDRALAKACACAFSCKHKVHAQVQQAVLRTFLDR